MSTNSQPTLATMRPQEFATQIRRALKTGGSAEHAAGAAGAGSSPGLEPYVVRRLPQIPSPRLQ